MFIIIGNTHFTHYRGRTHDEISCPHCGRKFRFVLNTVVSWFTFTFVPIFPYRVRRVLECPYCKNQLKVDGPTYDVLLSTRTKEKIRKI